MRYKPSWMSRCRWLRMPEYAVHARACWLFGRVLPGTLGRFTPVVAYTESVRSSGLGGFARGPSTAQAAQEVLCPGGRRGWWSTSGELSVRIGRIPGVLAVDDRRLGWRVRRRGPCRRRRQGCAGPAAATADELRGQGERTCPGWVPSRPQQAAHPDGPRRLRQDEVVHRAGDPRAGRLSRRVCTSCRSRRSGIRRWCQSRSPRASGCRTHGADRCWST